MITLDKYFRNGKIFYEFLERPDIRGQAMAGGVVIHIAEHNEATAGHTFERIQNAFWLCVRPPEMPVGGDQGREGCIALVRHMIYSRQYL